MPSGYPVNEYSGPDLCEPNDSSVAVEVEAVIPDAGPSEQCYEPDVIELLRQIESRAEEGDVEWLKGHGKVYAAVGAA